MRVTSPSRMLEITETLPGWLRPNTALFTHALIPHLPAGPAFEIGVFRGRYLSVIRSAMNDDSRLVGYDIFPKQQDRLVIADFARIYGPDCPLNLVTADSTTLAAERIRADCGGDPVFASIDGSHLVGPVLSDLRRADEVMHAEGVVAMDDIVNPLAIGVNEAFYRFSLDPARPARLVPFALFPNKLFLCRPEMASRYFDLTGEIVETLLTSPHFSAYKKRRDDKHPSDERDFLGQRILVVT